jgi:chromosome segregation ATPase
VSAQYDERARNSQLVLSVPVGRAQFALERLSALGEVTRQRFSLQDLQTTVDQLDAQADRLQQRIAELERQLRNPNLTPGERVALRARLDQAQRELQDVLAQRDATTAEGRSAEITLALTSEAAPKTSDDGVIGRAFDALRSVWTWVLAVLIVGAPFAVLLGLAYLAGRRLRRRANDRLLGS